MKMMFVLLAVIFSVSSMASIQLNPDVSQTLWKSVSIIEQFENANIIQKEDNRESFLIDTISCVFENYYACTFFAHQGHERKLVIAMDGAEKFVNELAKAGAYVDDDAAHLDATSLSCSKDHDRTTCTLEEFIPAIDQI